MNNIEHFILPEHTNNLYKNEAISSISLTKEVADKINELVDRYNELSTWNYEKHQEQDGKIRKGIIYMKDNLINTLNDLMELLLKNGFIDERIELYSKTLKEQLDNAISGLTADSEVIDSRVDYTGKVDKTLGEGLRRQFEELFSQMVNENLFKLKNLDYGYLQTDGKLTAKQSTYAVSSSEDVKRFELTSDFIEVEPNTTYYLKQYYLNENVDKAWFRIVSYDASKNVVASIDREYTEFTFTSGDNVKYVRISYRSFLTGIVKFERSTYPTPLIESFTSEINSLNDFIINGFVEGKTGILAREQSFVERMSTPIEVDAGDVFNMFAWGVYDSWYRITYYDKNYIVVSDTALYFNNITQKAFEIPENAKYMRVSIRSKGMSMFALIKDTNEQYPVLLEKFNGYLMNKPNLITPLKSIAHRGYCTDAPENTIHAFKLAVEKGFKYIEGDVVMTADGVPVLHHDDTIDRTSNSTGNVRDFTYKELYALDFGYKNLFGDKFSGTTIMTLNEFMSFCRKTGVHPYIELKSGIDADGIKKCVDIVKSYGMLNNCTWISFSKTELLNVLENCPYARIGYVYDKITEDVITNTLNLKTPFNDVFLDTNYNYLTDKAVKMCADINIPVEVYTVNNERAILTLNSYVSGVTSDCLIADEVYKNDTVDIPETDNDEPETPIIDNNPDKHAEYFTITDDGIISLKPEYRGACPSNRSDFTFAISDNGLDAKGSKNAELPKDLVIPEIVNEIAVSELAQGMFLFNKAIERITLPKFITVIPDRFCDNATSLKEIYNTEQISSMGTTALQKTHIEKAKFPNLTTVSGAGHFNNCTLLIYADIGNITTIPQQMFNNCFLLSRIKGGANVTNVDKMAFQRTYRLNSVDFLPNLKTIGEYAFFESRIDYDWNSLTGTTFGTMATSKQVNPVDIWSNCTIENANENPLPTFLSQIDERWSGKPLGTTGKTYSNSCGMFCIMHIYCGLHNITINTVEEWEAIANSIDPDFYNNYSAYYRDIKEMVEKLGLVCERYEEYNQENLQRLYDALSEGKYAIVSSPASMAATADALLGHVVTAYGIKENKEIMIANSCVHFENNESDRDRKLKYSMPFQNFISAKDGTPDEVDNYLINIISLPTE